MLVAKNSIVALVLSTTLVSAGEMPAEAEDSPESARLAERQYLSEEAVLHLEELSSPEASRTIHLCGKISATWADSYWFVFYYRPEGGSQNAAMIDLTTPGAAGMIGTALAAQTHNARICFDKDEDTDIASYMRMST